MPMEYRCEAVSVAGFVQQVAQAYIPKGYRYYAVRRIPKGKDPQAVDRKLMELYGVEASKSRRYRRKQRGLANVLYCRHGRFALLVATPQWLLVRRGGRLAKSPRPGGHVFFQECPDYKDFRKEPLHFAGYEIMSRFSTSDGKWHASVRIAQDRFSDLEGYFKGIALARDVEGLENEFRRRLHYEPFAVVAKQYLRLLGTVREMRAGAGLPVPSWQCVRLRRKSVFPFGDPDDVFVDEAA